MAAAPCYAFAMTHALAFSLTTAATTAATAPSRVRRPTLRVTAV